MSYLFKTQKKISEKKEGDEDSKLLRYAISEKKEGDEDSKLLRYAILGWYIHEYILK